MIIIIVIVIVISELRSPPTTPRRRPGRRREWGGRGGTDSEDEKSGATPLGGIFRGCSATHHGDFQGPPVRGPLITSLYVFIWPYLNILS